MAPLPPESTARYYYDYTDGVNQHTIVARLGATIDLETAGQAVNGFLLAIAPVWNLITTVGARFSSDNSNVTNPTDWPGAATYGTGPMDTANAPREVRFIGRSVDGRMVSVSVYGYGGATPASYRLPASTNVEIADGIAALESAAVNNVFLTISTAVPVWKNYASFNFNSYWERKARP